VTTNDRQAAEALYEQARNHGIRAWAERMLPLALWPDVGLYYKTGARILAPALAELARERWRGCLDCATTAAQYGHRELACRWYHKAREWLAVAQAGERETWIREWGAGGGLEVAG
jgi:hypothetical protein